jgi:hypothetical protein
MAPCPADKRICSSQDRRDDNAGYYDSP